MPNSSVSQLLSRSLESVVVESFVGIVLTVSAIAGNILVLVAVYRNPRLRKASSVYIVCLSLTDLFSGVFTFPIVDATLISGKFPGGQILCWYQATFSAFLLMTSLLTMVMIAVQRYYKIVKPNKYRNIFSTRFIVLSIVLIWCTTLALIILFTLISGHGVQFAEQFPICLPVPDTITVIIGYYFFGLLLPFLVMSLLYFKIWRFIKTHNAQISHSNVNAEEVKLTKSLCIVLGAFAACYTPFTVATTIDLNIWKVTLPRQMYVFTLFMLALASVINPVIYCATNREFRKEFAKIVCCPRKPRFAARVESVP